MGEISKIISAVPKDQLPAEVSEKWRVAEETLVETKRSLILELQGLADLWTDREDAS
jgi:hypothetical protein